MSGAIFITINGIDAFDESGRYVSSAGDVNGDGIDDLIIGANYADPNGAGSGESYVVFGSSDGFASTIELSSLDGTNGFVLNGIDGNDLSGKSLSSAGDVNGDGIDDLIIGAHYAGGNGTNAGESYVVFGSDAGFAASFELSSLDGTNGFVLNGIDDNNNSGSSVSSAGDVNGDGIDDLIIGAPYGGTGESYVVFGNDAGFAASFDLSSLDGTNGFVLNGIDAGDLSGYSVSSAGDVNGDGIDDLIIGAPNGDPNGSGSGESYVVFGSNAGFAASFDLSSLDGTNGFVLNGIDADDWSGYSVSSAGDVNGDGIDDLIIGAPYADPNGANSGESYVVFGSSGGFAASFDLSSLDGTNGFVLNGIDAGDFNGRSVSSAGDVNGDGIDDLIIGATFADPNGNFSGESYLVFGSATNFSASFDLSSLDGTNGFVINGIDAFDYSGRSVSAAGDVNGDGFDDLIIGAYRADPNGSSSGESYVVLGGEQFLNTLDAADGTSDGTIEIASAQGTTFYAGLVIKGVDVNDYSGLSVSSAGDVNGDGIDDLIIGAYYASPNGNGSGESYVVFGSAGGFASTIELSSLDGTNGFVLNGIDNYDYSGYSVSSAGDLNGDGIDDLIIGANYAGPNGSSYVVFGSNAGFAASFELSSLDGTNGFVLNGIDGNDNSGISVSSAGDVNGDGFDDLIIGAFAADPNGSVSGESYVVFGSNAGFAASFELSSLDGTNGFVLNGIDAGDSSGISVSSAGDVNGDGIDDLIIGAHYAGGNGGGSGESYVVFGSNAGFAASFELSSLDGTNGFVLNGIDGNDNSGISVSSAGDVNGDGIDDLIIGAHYASPNGGESGESYVVFGSNAGFAASFDLSSLDGTNGFVLNGIDAYDNSGRSVSSAGDVNGDGIDDLIIGASRADPNGSNSGESYLVFGSDAGFAANLDLSSLDGTNGFVLHGIDAGDYSGRSVSSAGDVNGDGIDDLIIGANDADPNGGSSGESYVIFGGGANLAALDTEDGLGDGQIQLSNLDIAYTQDQVQHYAGLVINGIDSGDESGRSVSGAGDINGDGIGDFIIGAPDADPSGSDSGESYVVFGTASGFDASLELSSLDGSNGFVLNGVGNGDFSGFAVSSAGDVNGDGIDDLIIGANSADPNGSSSGESYVVFGDTGGFAASFNLSSLDGTNGFVLNGVGGGDFSGVSVSSAGDVNGDGIDDLIIGAPNGDPNGTSSGESYVVFGDSGGFAASFELSSLDGTNGFVLNGIDAGDGSGFSVSSAGDVNGDGIDDLIIGANSADPNGTSSGESYVVFGDSGGFAASFELSSLDGTNGFVLNGIDAYDYSGRSVSSAGDVNGDGFDDLIIGAWAAGGFSGESYVVFGSSGGFAASLDLSSLDGTNGFVLNGIDGNSGYSVSSAGDVNGDGIDDLIIGAKGATSDGSYSGESYVVFGDSDGFAASFDLSSLNGSNGFVLHGIDAGDHNGVSVSAAGDVNGDGIDDLIIGADRADPNGGSSGESYVIFGGGANLAALDTEDGLGDGQIQLSNLGIDYTQGEVQLYAGLVINGIDAGDYSGNSVSSAGDINGDGIDDIIIGAPYGNPNGYNSGESYVVFGATSGFDASLELSSLDGTNGFVINGVNAPDYSGRSVSSAGDVNGDGIDDLIIGARTADPNGTNTGESYVVFGSGAGFAASLELSSLDGTNGFVLNGIDAGDFSGGSVSSAGDVNGDGIDDLIIGAAHADPNGPNSGESYVVFGSSGGFAASFELSSLDGTNGFVLNGIDAGDRSGFSVSAAGDVNGDGIDDLIIGAYHADTNGAYSGESYVVFGDSGGFAASFDLSSLDGTNGFVLNGIDAYDYSGVSVSSAGDVNGDGIDDLIIGAKYADPNGGYSGESYVVFGSSGGFAASFDLSSLDGTNGFVLNGIDANDTSGISVSSAGDVNGDGFDDMLIGAAFASPNGSNSGESYLVFGSDAGFAADFDLSSLDGSNGYIIGGIDAGDRSGFSVSSVGDVNGDGIDDLIIGANHADPNGASSGESYVIFGGGANLAALDAEDGLGDGTIALSNLGIAYTSGAVCFARGTHIRCGDAYRRIEDLRPGDHVSTQDHGTQKIRWIGCRKIDSAELADNPKLRPVRIRQGALGLNQPSQDLWVSRQHRILVNSSLMQEVTGEDRALMPAIKLTGLPGVEIDKDIDSVEYYHILCDNHELLWAEDTPAESLYLGKHALATLSHAAQAEIATIFPQTQEHDFQPDQACSFLDGKVAKTLISKHANHAVNVLC